jgi:hypothetical protein
MAFYQRGGYALLITGIPFIILYFIEWIVLHKRWSDKRIHKD